MTATFPILQKPLWKEPCNLCGLCCRMEPCAPAQILMEQFEGACRALESNADGTTSCGIVTDPLKYTSSAKFNEIIAFLKRTWPDQISAHLSNSEAFRISLGDGTCDTRDVPGVTR